MLSNHKLQLQALNFIAAQRYWAEECDARKVE